MPDKASDENLTELSETDEADDDKFTEEWYSSVEKRFQDFADFMQSRGSHESPATPPSAAESAGQPTSGTPSDSAVGASTPGDTRPPKSDHFWFRHLGE